MNTGEVIIDIDSMPTRYHKENATVIIGVNAPALNRYFQFCFTADFFFKNYRRGPRTGIGAYFIVKPKLKN